MNKVTVAKDISYKIGEINFNNFEVVKENLSDYLKKYKVVISEEDVKESKKDAADLNKLKKSLKEKEKEVVKAYEEPVLEFKKKIKELENIINDTREFLVSQVKKYEGSKKEEIKEIIEKYISDLYSLNDIPESYRTIDVFKYLKLSAVTKSGNISKSADTEISNDISKILLQIQADEIEKMKKEAELKELKQQIKEEVREEVLEEVKTPFEKVEEPVIKEIEDGFKELNICVRYKFKTKKSVEEVIEIVQSKVSTLDIKAVEIKTC